MTTAKKNTRLNNIINDLCSSEEKKVLTALKQLRKHGKKEAIKPIVKLLSSTENSTVQSTIENLLFDLKDQTVVEEIIELIANNDYPSKTATLVSIFWQSSLDSSSHLSTFVRQAIVGDYTIGIEVLSVIDSYESTFQETEVEDLKLDLDEAISQETSEKQKLLMAIRQSLDELNLEF